MSKIKDILMLIRHANRVDMILNDDEFLSHRLEAEIIGNVHSIEKGLSLEQPRKLFGLKKIDSMLGQIDRYLEQLDSDGEIVQMAVDAIGAYLHFHDDKEYEELTYIKNKYNGYVLKYSTRETMGTAYCLC